MRSAQVRRVARDASPEQIQRIMRMALRVAKVRGKSRHQSALVLADMIEEAGWPKNPNDVPTGRTGRPVTYNVRSVDAWGNAEDGFEVNQTYNAGTIRFPSREYISNVIWYRNQFLKTGLTGPTALRALDPNYDIDDETRFKRFRAEYLQPHVKRHQIRFESFGDGNIEVTSTKDGQPLYFMEAQ